MKTLRAVPVALGKVLCSLFLLALLASNAHAGTTRVTVSGGNPEFTDSGIELSDGEQATITATGQVSYGSEGPSECQGFVSPKGCASEAICHYPGGCGGLIGRLNDGAAFAVGDRKVVTGPGRLEFIVNDLQNLYGDNSGAFAVAIAISGETISGSVTGLVCDDSNPTAAPAQACRTDGVSGVRVVAMLHGGITKSSHTDAEGNYAIHVKKSGMYIVKASGANSKYTPVSKNVTVRQSDVKNVNFKKHAPDTLTLISKVDPGSQDTIYTLAANPLIAKGGTLKICNENNFAIIPVCESAGNEFTIKRYNSGCRSVAVHNRTGSVDVMEVFDGLHIHADARIFIAPN